MGSALEGRPGLQAGTTLRLRCLAGLLVLAGWLGGCQPEAELAQEGPASVQRQTSALGEDGTSTEEPETDGGLSEPGEGAPTPPWVVTDKADYVPEETVQIAGGAFHADEPLTVQVVHTNELPTVGEGHEPWTVLTDADGNFFTTWYVNPDDSFGSSFMLSAECPHGLRAESLFTDSGAVEFIKLLDSGYYRHVNGGTPQHNPNETSYLVGRWVQNSLPYVHRNFFVFDLAGISGKVTTATVTFVNPGGQGSGTYSLYEVKTPVDQLVAGGPSQTIYDDLGDGVKYASEFIEKPGTKNISFDLNAEGLSAVQSALGTRFALGGEFSADYGWLFDQSSSALKTELTLHIDAKDKDKTPPVLSVPSNIVAEATGASGATVSYTASAVDETDGVLTASCTPASGATFPLGTTTVSCTAVDKSGNTSLPATFTVTVRDTTAPVLANVPGNLVAEATDPQGAAVTFVLPTASDLVDGSVTASCTPASGATFALGTTTVTCSARDVRNNVASTTFRVTVRDTTAPLIAGLPAPIVAEATGPGGALVSFALPTASDAVSGSVAVACSPSSGSRFALGTTSVACTATDAAGNASTARFDVTVRDTIAPVLAGVPGPLVAEATGPGGSAVTYALPTASDAVSGGVAVVCTPASGSQFALAATLVACSATDAAGNTGTATFSVTVQDTTPPALLGVPVDLVVEATGPHGASVDFVAPTAQDLVDGTVAVHCSAAPGDTFALGQTSVTCAATDARGNTRSAGFTVTVRDTIAPVLSLPADFTLEATGPSGAVATFATSAEDLVAGSVAVHCTPDTGTTLALGKTQVSCDASDTYGNTAYGSFTVTVVDTTPPVLSDVPANLTAEATGPAGAQVLYTAPTAQDLVDGSVAVGCSPRSGDTFALGTHTVRCTAADAAGNLATAEFTVTVQDTTPPELSVPAPLTLEATGPAGATASFAATASDLVDGSVAVSCSPAAGSTFALGTTSVACSATDAAGNLASASFTVTVQDTTAPVLSLPGDLTREATGPTGAAVSFSTSAQDLVDGEVAVTCAPASGATFALGTTLVTCEASDVRGNRARGVFSVEVVDTTAPVIAGTADLVAEATDPAGALVTWPAPTATDAVTPYLVVTCTPASGTRFALGTTGVRCSATDAAGNEGSASFQVTVRDTTAPTFPVLEDLYVVATSTLGSTVSYSVSATDLVDGAVSPTCSPASGSLFAPGTTHVTCSAVDARGNTATAGFDVHVAFAWTGLLQPINPDGTSVFKLGSTVPVKFRLAGASAGLTGLTARLFVAKVTDSVVGTEAEVQSTSAADTGNTFRYSATDAQYIFNLATRGLSVGTWQLRVDLGDGVSHTVLVSLKK